MYTWKLLSNFKATFNLENVNLLSNHNVNPKNGVAYKNKKVYFDYLRNHFKKLNTIETL